MDYGPMLAHHAERGAQVTIGCLEVPLDQAREFGVMEVGEDSRVLNFAEKPKSPVAVPGKPDVALASMGIYVFDARFLLDWLTDDAGRSESSHDFGKDVIPSAIRAAKVYAYPFRDLYEPNRQGYWRDVGTVDAYWRTNLELTGMLPELDLYDERWPIWTHQAQVPPAKFIFDKPGERGQAISSMVSGGCIVAGASVKRSVLFVNSRVEPGALIEESLLLPRASIGRRCRIQRAVIDEGCVIPDGTVIGEDRERDARLYHVSPGGVTLVTAEMLKS
jgi:glucose-1-phosphate adenylyltransferase